jgi:LacI family transcriptional regulator
LSEQFPVQPQDTVTKRKRARRSSDSSIKLADVARVAGVSTATASRALNFPDRVLPETRERIEAAIRSLNWIPHGAAKALASLRTRTIGALIPNLGHQTIAAMLETLQQELGDAGYTLLLGRPDPSPERTLRQASKMLEHGIEALVLMGEAQPPILMEFLERRGAFYVIGYTSGRQGMRNCIGFDNYREMSKLVEHLLDLGHVRFGLLTRSFEGNDRIQQRIQAVRDCLARQGLAIRPQHDVIVDSWQMGAGRQGMRRILGADGPRPTAVVCANDYLAAGAVIEAKAAGLEIPRDISVTGFDDLELAAQIEPPLTTIKVPAPELGRRIAQFIIETLEKGSATLPERLSADLVIRGTTGRPSL